MTIIGRAELTVPTLDIARADVNVATGTGGTDVDLAVGTLLGGLTVHVGLDRVLNSASPIDHLLNGPDALARFRAGAVPADPSPVATRGMSIRAGDPYQEVATRYAVGGTTALAAARIDASVRRDDGGIGVRASTGGDPGGVPTVRDPVAAAAVPQRITAPGGSTAADGGIRAGVTLGTVIVPTAGGGERSVAVSFDGLVNRLGSAGVGTPGEAPTGAVLVYQRSDGATAIELRTAGGFAGATATSAQPLTGSVAAREGEGFTLVAVLVAPEGVPHSPFLAATVAAAAPAAAAAVASEPVAPAPDAAPPPGEASLGATRADATAAAAPPAAGASERSAASAATLPPGGTAPSAENAAAPPPPPDGSQIPAGNPAAAGEPRDAFDSATSDRGDADGPYVFALWYDILALRFADLGVSLADRSVALRDAVWATAIEHGPFADAGGADILSAIARGTDIAACDDAVLIAALFAERARTDADGALVHFPHVLPADRERVVARLADEAGVAAARNAAG